MVQSKFYFLHNKSSIIETLVVPNNKVLFLRITANKKKFSFKEQMSQQVRKWQIHFHHWNCNRLKVTWRTSEFYFVAKKFRKFDSEVIYHSFVSPNNMTYTNSRAQKYLSLFPNWCNCVPAVEVLDQCQISSLFFVCLGEGASHIFFSIVRFRHSCFLKKWFGVPKKTTASVSHMAQVLQWHNHYLKTEDFLFSNYSQSPYE